MIGFLMPHKKSDLPIYNFVVSVDYIEKITGIDFFPELDNATENELEAQQDYKKWSFQFTDSLAQIEEEIPQDFAEL